MWLGRPSSSQQVALIRGAIGAGRGDWPGHKFNGPRRPAWPGHYFNGSGGGALGMYPWWPTGPWNGALGATGQTCYLDRQTVRALQQKLDAGLEIDGYLCCGRGADDPDHFVGHTYNAIAWRYGIGDWSDSAQLRFPLTRPVPPEPALAAAHDPDAVAGWQVALGIPPVGCLTPATAARLDNEVSGWKGMATAAITAALAAGGTPEPEPLPEPSPAEPEAAASSGLSTAAKAGIALGLVGVVGLVWAGSGRRKTRRGR